MHRLNQRRRIESLSIETFPTGHRRAAKLPERLPTNVLENGPRFR